mmetsp:Transcript_105849/g.236286  ORF Transcript_105849/g.236286 Transcript_105849/m.236286 type:complete len:265 (-) Transcript_105849:664-1458(-)
MAAQGLICNCLRYSRCFSRTPLSKSRALAKDSISASRLRFLLGSASPPIVAAAVGEVAATASGAVNTLLSALHSTAAACSASGDFGAGSNLVTSSNASGAATTLVTSFGAAATLVASSGASGASGAATTSVTSSNATGAATTSVTSSGASAAATTFVTSNSSSPPLPPTSSFSLRLYFCPDKRCESTTLVLPRVLSLSMFEFQTSTSNELTSGLSGNSNSLSWSQTGLRSLLMTGVWCLALPARTTTYGSETSPRMPVSRFRRL